MISKTVRQIWRLRSVNEYLECIPSFNFYKQHTIVITFIHYDMIYRKIFFNSCGMKISRMVILSRFDSLALQFLKLQFGVIEDYGFT